MEPTLTKKVEIPALNPELFTRELHVNEYGKPLGLLDGVSVSPIQHDILGAAIRRRAIGFCEGTRLPFRPIDGGIVGLMCEDKDFNKFWFHLPRKTFDENFIEEGDRPCQLEEG